MRVQLERKLNVFFFAFIHEILPRLLNPLVQRVFVEDKFAFSHFHLAYIQYQINQVLHPLRLFVDAF